MVERSDQQGGGGKGRLAEAGRRWGALGGGDKVQRWWALGGAGRTLKSGRCGQGARRRRGAVGKAHVEGGALLLGCSKAHAGRRAVEARRQLKAGLWRQG
jgi:hypothetical protein